jgi:hypothetical protein
MESWPLVELAWAAGFFEGEGSITLRVNSLAQKEGRKPRPIVTLECKVAQVDPEPLVKLARLFGGTVRLRARKNPKHNVISVWRITCREAAAFLTAILPYVVRPRVVTRIALAVEFQGQKRIVGRSPEVESYRLKQFDYHEMMRRLNVKGTQN